MWYFLWFPSATRFTVIHLHLSGWKRNSYLSDHICSSFRSACRFFYHLRLSSSTLRKTLVSSAGMHGSSRYLEYHWWTGQTVLDPIHYLAVYRSVLPPSWKSTHLPRLVVVDLARMPLSIYGLYRWFRSWSVLLEDVDEGPCQKLSWSQYTLHRVILLRLVSVSTRSILSVRNCSVVERPPIKPNCLGLNSLFNFIWVRILSLTNDWSTLHTMLVRLTGL